MENRAGQDKVMNVMPPDKKRDPRAAVIIESLRNGASIVAACKAAQIHPMTFWRWRQEDADLDADTEAAITGRIMVVEDSLYNECTKGNSTLIMFFLMNRASAKWKDRRAMPHISASAQAGATAEAALHDPAAARKRIGRSMRIIRELGLESELSGQD